MTYKNTCSKCGKERDCFSLKDEDTDQSSWICHPCFNKYIASLDHTQFREDVRACLINVLSHEEFSQQPWPVIVSWAIEGAEEIEKQLKEKGRI